MAFLPVKSLDGASDPFEYLYMTDSEAVTLGETLKMVNGRLTLASGTDDPEFIAMASAAAGTNVRIPVVRLDDEREWEVPCTGQIANTGVGTKVTIHTDGLQVTTITTGGVFLISQTDGANPSTVRGYFKR